MALKLDKTNLVRNLAKKTKFVVHLDRAIKAKEYEWSASFSPKKTDDAWHPSGDCTPSPHQLYHKAKDHIESAKNPDFQYVADYSEGLRKTFAVGHFWHAYLQHVTVHGLGFCGEEHVERQGLKVWEYDPPRMSGTSPKAFHWATGAGDLAPVDIPGHGEFIVDFKTMGSHDFKRQGLPDWCADKYEAQINVYMDFFDLERALIVCINKDTPHDFKEFEYRRNQPLIDAVYKKWELVSLCLDEGVEPPVDEEIALPFGGPVE